MAKGDDAVSLTLVRTIRAPVHKVFAAWTDPAQVAQWLAPGDLTATVQLQAQKGGRYRVAMTKPDGSVHVVGGEYREVEPNRRIVKTWRWEGSATDTLLTVAFRELDADRTELALTHERFRDAEMRGKHEHGWAGSFAKLEKLMAR